MELEWKKDDREHWILLADGQPCAVIYFIGGHVERPDAWHTVFRDDRFTTDMHGDLDVAKSEVERLVREKLDPTA